ncbi:uncharacterized protein BDV14DRAFT_197189 [Aspergillus stella-maris]|uniref:uncharacterized protein n=1 Tax=Aspergillus stella-maris TaxID=1810926 RepID=UPI003CCD05C6
MSSDFLFVDFGDAKSQRLALSKRKHAFLQKKHHQRRKEESLLRLKTSIRPFANGSTSGPTADNARQLQSRQPDDQISHVPLMPLSLQKSISPGLVDPFSTLPISMAGQMDSYFYHYKNSFSRSIYPFEPDKMSAFWWQRSSDDPALIQAILGTSAWHQSCLRQATGTCAAVASKSAMDSIQLRSRSMKSLQHVLGNLAEAFLETTILTIAKLICVESGTAKLDAVSAHVSGLIRLVHLRGGLDNLEDTTITTIYSGDYVRGLLTGSPPAFPMSSAWKNRLIEQSRISKGTRENSITEIPGLRFFTSPWSRDLDPTMKSLLRLFQRLTLLIKPTEYEDCTGTLADNNLVILAGHQLLSLFFSGALARFQESLRLAMVVYSAFRIFDLQFMPNSRIIVDDLDRTLHSSFPMLKDKAPDLLFWILFVGGLASQDLDCHDWFVVRLAEVAECLEIYDWITALSLLRQFFFVIRPAETKPECLWNEVLTRQTHTLTSDAPHLH